MWCSLRLPRRLLQRVAGIRGVAYVSAVLISGCGPSVAPAVVPEAVPAPAPAPTPRPLPPAVPVTYTVPSMVAEQRYQLSSRTVLDRDSAGRPDTQELTGQAEAVVRVRREANGSFDGGGQILSYRLRSGLSSTPITLDSLRFDAVLDARALRLATQPPLINECDRPETGALSMLRDVLLRVPSRLTIGDHWRDSTVQLVCRLSVPMVVRTTSHYTVADTVRDGRGMHLILQRASELQISGKSSTAWRVIDVSGTGTASLNARVSVESGVVEEVTGESRLTLTMTDRTNPALVRAQTVLQRVTQSARVITP